ncbi:hypothetical protein MAR621_03111 [Maribacter dokdonensis]|uniref:hypothetical protein n=1 Tax=Maribacter dokdonensis TaxID=320912 RepID=UPI001B0C23E4|nr:hypothetical protein [Maribacter dokdonensis]CAG2532917.1 hypothetical protein MAR621_03111 [Maribacter dokdonensis]
MEELKQKLIDDKLVRWFLRSLTGLLLVFYTGYMIYMKATTHTIPLATNDWLIIVGSTSMWAAWEGVRMWLVNKLKAQ